MNSIRSPISQEMHECRLKQHAIDQAEAYTVSG